MGRKRRKAPKILLHPMFQWIRGKMGKIVYRLSHNGEVSAYPTPDMTNIVWSPAQKAEPERRARATAYAIKWNFCPAFPNIRISMRSVQLRTPHP